MPKADINLLIDLLTEYEDGDLDEHGTLALKDEILDLNEQLFDEEIEEGWQYDSTSILIKKGQPLPQPHRGMKFETVLSSEKQTIKIKEITGLRRNKNGELLVDAIVKRVKN